MSEAIQRKLAAILSADVAGYSRLMGTDETGTFSALGECAASPTASSSSAPDA
jgi:class 3 adenylate cyclase